MDFDRRAGHSRAFLTIGAWTLPLHGAARVLMTGHHAPCCRAAAVGVRHVTDWLTLRREPRDGTSMARSVIRRADGAHGDALTCAFAIEELLCVCRDSQCSCSRLAAQGFLLPGRGEFMGGCPGGEQSECVGGG
jgi:hypothetical protein